MQPSMSNVMMNMKEKRPTTNNQQSTHQLAGQPTGPSPFPSPEGRGVDSEIPLVINMSLQVDKFTCKQVVLLEY